MEKITTFGGQTKTEHGLPPRDYYKNLNLINDDQVQYAEKIFGIINKKIIVNSIRKIKEDNIDKRIIDNKSEILKIIDFKEISENKQEFIKTDLFSFSVIKNNSNFIVVNKRNIKINRTELDILNASSGFGNSNLIRFRFDTDSYISEINLEKLDLSKKLCFVFCEKFKPYKILELNNLSIEKLSNNTEKNEILINDRKIHQIGLIKYLQKYTDKLKNIDLLKISWFEAIHTNILLLKVMHFGNKNRKFESPKDIVLKNEDEKASINTTYEIINKFLNSDFEKTYEIVNSFLKDKKLRKNFIDFPFIYSFKENIKFNQLVETQIYSVLFEFYLSSAQFTNYGLRNYSVELFGDKEISSLEIDYDNLPEYLNEKGQGMNLCSAYWLSQVAVSGASNDSFHYNLNQSVSGNEFPMLDEIIKETFDKFDLDESISVDEIKKNCRGLLDEANSFKNWTLRNGSFFVLNINNIIGVQLYEVFDDIVAKFITKDGFYFKITLHTPTLNSAGESILYWAFRDNKENLINQTSVQDLKNHKSNRIFWALTQLICVIIRDYWVIEKKEKVFSETKNREYLPRNYNNSKSVRIIYLPRIKYTNAPKVKNQFQKMEYEKRAKHFVRAFMRKSTNSSSLQKYLASQYNLEIPEGHTFVKPHERGIKKDQEIIYRSRSALNMLYQENIHEPGSNSRWFKFEKDIKKLLEFQNMQVEHYSASKRNDDGIDIVAIKKKKEEIETHLYQCKCYKPKNKIGPDIVRELIGSMIAFGGKCTGWIVTTSSLTDDSIRLIKDFKTKGYEINYLEGEDIAKELMRNNN